MRHRKKSRRFGRTSEHRRAMFRNMGVSLIKHESMQTTVIKAKELRSFVEPIIALAKVDTDANRRLVFNRLRSKDAVIKVFADLGPRTKNRSGGYLRILKCGFRQSDKAPMAIVELVDKAAEVAAS